mgnify:CR=1 FL=1
MTQQETFDLVVLAGQSVDARFVHVFARHPHTTFVVVDLETTGGRATASATGQAWTPDEIQMLHALAKKGMALKAIAKALTRSEESVKERAKADGLSIAKLH